MHQRGKMFWEWSLDEWMDTICPNRMLFYEKHGPMPGCRMSIMDMAYLFGGVTDLRVMGMRAEMAETAQAYFGKTLIMEQCQRVHEALNRQGYEDSEANILSLRQGLCTLFVLNRSPHLEELSEDLVQQVSTDGRHMHYVMLRVTLGLQHLRIL